MLPPGSECSAFVYTSKGRKSMICSRCICECCFIICCFLLYFKEVIKMFNLIWPVAIVVTGNCLYNVCSKATPHNANLFLSLTAGYIAAALVCAVICIFTMRGSSFGSEISKLNWASYCLGLTMVFLEIGGICLYRVGWNVSTGPIVTSICSAAALFILGVLVFKDAVNITKVIGLLTCGIGIFLINK